MTATPPVLLDTDLRDRIAYALEREDSLNWGYDHGFCPTYGTDPETDAFVAAVLAVVQPVLAARDIEIQQLPPWEAVYESATFTSRLLAYCQDETTARGAAEAWLREHCTDAAGLVWTPDPQMAVREWDRWLSLSSTAEDGTPLDTEIVVRRRTTTAQEG